MTSKCDALVDRLYEAVLAPPLWPDLLRDIADYFAAEECSLLRFPDGGAPEVLSVRFAAEEVDGFRLSAWKESPSIALAMGRPPGTLVPLGEGVPAALLERDAAMRILFDEGIRHATGYLTPAGSGGRVGFLIGRSTARGPLTEALQDDLSRICGHLRRLRGIAVNMAGGEARAITEALNQIHIPAAAITHDKRVLAVNTSFAESFAFLTAGSSGRIMLNDPDEDARFSEAFSRLARSRRPATATVVSGASGRGRARILRLIAVHGAASDILCDTPVVLTVSQGHGRPAPEEELAAIHGFTPAEARLARRMVAGEPLCEIAKTLGVTIHTVRTQLQSLMAKTGTRRQLDLVQLLSGF